MLGRVSSCTVPPLLLVVTSSVMSRLLLVRHCESSGPQPGCPLTDRGREQAERLAAFLVEYPIDALVSSPYRRACDTIAPFADATGLAVAVDPRLAERRMSAEPDVAWKETLRRSFADPDHRLPGAESARETVARGRAAVEELLGGAHRLPVAVSHGQLMSLILHAFDSRFGFAGWAAMSTPDVYLLVSDTGGVRFERVWRAEG
jgi:2,3-bisphosphoglycerate-dependent phosphoglycerate mutase